MRLCFWAVLPALLLGLTSYLQASEKKPKGPKETSLKGMIEKDGEEVILRVADQKFTLQGEPGLIEQAKALVGKEVMVSGSRDQKTFTINQVKEIKKGVSKGKKGGEGKKEKESEKDHE